MRTKLGEKKGAWPELLRKVLWAYRTSHKATTSEINLTSHWMDTYDPNENEELLCLNRDLLEERREQANLRNAEHKNRLKRKFDKNAKVRYLKLGDWG